VSDSDLELGYLPEFADDVRALPTQRLQRIVIQRLVDISKGRLEGKPLDERVATGDLSDCRKLYFDETGGMKPRYRLVYRLLPNEVQATEVQAVATGEREALVVYYEAARRLGRLPHP
jgi:hypothetical protein